MARKKPTSGARSGEEPSFESALAELEEIVAAMEEEQLPLEELVARYEKGSKLLSRCESVLVSARKRLQTISAKAAADAAISADEDESPDDDDDEPAGPASGTPDEYDDDDDIRLF